MLLLSLLLFIVGVNGLPHMELEDEDSPCIHAPCDHGVCVTNKDIKAGYRYRMIERERKKRERNTG